MVTPSLVVIGPEVYVTFTAGAQQFNLMMDYYPTNQEAKDGGRRLSNLLGWDLLIDCED